MSYQIIPKALIVGLGVVGLVCWDPGIWAKPTQSNFTSANSYLGDICEYPSSASGPRLANCH
jgi:hypothetical protein